MLEVGKGWWDWNLHSVGILCTVSTDCGMYLQYFVYVCMCIDKTSLSEFLHIGIYTLRQSVQTRVYRYTVYSCIFIFNVRWVRWHFRIFYVLKDYPTKHEKNLTILNREDNFFPVNHIWILFCNWNNKIFVVK